MGNYLKQKASTTFSQCIHNTTNTFMKQIIEIKPEENIGLLGHYVLKMLFRLFKITRQEIAQQVFLYFYLNFVVVVVVVFNSFLHALYY